MSNLIKAEHAELGVWRFTCEAHPEPVRVQCISSPQHSFQIMREHIDREHPGEQFTMKRSSDYSGEAAKRYTGRRNEIAGLYENTRWCLRGL